MLASHNSATYLRPREWWMRPFSFMARCQSKNIIEQFEAGARLFDFRIRCTGKIDDKTGRPEVIITHGIIEYAYPGVLYDLLSEINWLSEYHQKKVWIIVVYDDTFGHGDHKTTFPMLCRKLVESYLHLDFQFIISKRTWEITKDFNKIEWNGSRSNFWRFSWKSPLPLPFLYNTKVTKEDKESRELVFHDFI